MKIQKIPCDISQGINFPNNKNIIAKPLTNVKTCAIIYNRISMGDFVRIYYRYILASFHIKCKRLEVKSNNASERILNKNGVKM